MRQPLDELQSRITALEQEVRELRTEVALLKIKDNKSDIYGETQTSSGFSMRDNQCEKQTFYLQY